MVVEVIVVVVVVGVAGGPERVEERRGRGDTLIDVGGSLVIMKMVKKRRIISKRYNCGSRQRRGWWRRG